MKVRGTVRRRAGRDGWWARVIYEDPDDNDRRKELLRKAPTRSAAIDLRDKLVQEVKRTQARAVKHERETFAQLAAYCRKNYAVPPVFDANGRLREGKRSYRDIVRHINRLEKHFGAKRLRSITWADLDALRRELLGAPMVLRYAAGSRDAKSGKRAKVSEKTLEGKMRTDATVNRVLTVCRRMFKIAMQLHWLEDNPFNRGDALIRTKKEVERTRILSPDEEKRLLAACEADVRKNLRQYLIFLLDTGARTGEAHRLQWKDVDFTTSHLTLIATKTESTRTIRMTGRLERELRARFEKIRPTPGESVFGVKTGMQSAFRTACKIAKIEDLHFHDLRHTFGTRLAQSDLNVAEVGRLLGHSQLSKVTYRYINLAQKTRDRAADALNAINEAAEAAEAAEEPAAVN